MLFLYRRLVRRAVRGPKAEKASEYNFRQGEAKDMGTTSEGTAKGGASAKGSQAAKAKQAATTEIEDSAIVTGRQARAEMMVKDHMLVSLGVGVLPFPLLDIATGIASQVVLVRRLCTLYEVPFSESAARAAIMSLSASIGSTGMAVVVGFSLGKLIPGIGTAAGMVALPVANAAMTYAIGKIFIGHFEMGGTLFDFDPRSNKVYFRDFYARGREVASDLIKRTPKASEATAESAAEATATAAAAATAS